MLALSGVPGRASAPCGRTGTDRQALATAWITATRRASPGNLSLHDNSSGGAPVIVDWRIGPNGVIFRFFDNLLAYSRSSLTAQAARKRKQAARVGLLKEGRANTFPY